MLVKYALGIFRPEGAPDMTRLSKKSIKKMCCFLNLWSLWPMIDLQVAVNTFKFPLEKRDEGKISNCWSWDVLQNSELENLNILVRVVLHDALSSSLTVHAQLHNLLLCCCVFK